MLAGEENAEHPHGMLGVFATPVDGQSLEARAWISRSFSIAGFPLPRVSRIT